jgi:malonyl-CoA/methylmalonyl-CoA synthetase
MSNLFCAIAETARARSASSAFETPDGSLLKFQDLLDDSARYALLMHRFGVMPGDRVLVQVDKRLDVVPLYLGVLRAGAVYLPLNTGYTDVELRYFVEDAAPRLAIVEPARENIAHDLMAGQPVFTQAALSALAREEGIEHDVVARASDELAAILYTSGTTGRSKGAMLTHGNLESNARSLTALWGFSSDDVLLHTLPIYHVHGLFVALHCALLSGARTLFHNRFDAQTVKRALRDATVFMGVPTYYTRLLQEPDFPLPDTRLRLWVSGSAPLRAEVFAAFEARTGSRILERYGMTEAGMITSNPLDGERVAGAVGRPLPGVEARVRDASGVLAGADQPGVLEIRGPNVFAGYWRNPEKTAESFTLDGWFVTGDVATIDSRGIVRLVGREKDLIISGGLNVYPKEVEDELDALDGVRESAVIGVPHPDFGEAVVAVIDADGAPDASSIVRTMRTRLAAFKVPKRVVFVDELPRNAMGKVQKKVLRERYGALFE